MFFSHTDITYLSWRIRRNAVHLWKIYMWKYPCKGRTNCLVAKCRSSHLFVNSSTMMSEIDCLTKHCLHLMGVVKIYLAIPQLILLSTLRNTTIPSVAKKSEQDMFVKKYAPSTTKSENSIFFVWRSQLKSQGYWPWYLRSTYVSWFESFDKVKVNSVWQQTNR